MQGVPDTATFIRALMGEDNNLREQMEKLLDNLIASQPWMLAEQLIKLIDENRAEPAVIQYAFVVLKHIFSELSNYGTSRKEKDKAKFAAIKSGVDLQRYGQVMINYLVMVSKQPDSPMRMHVIRAVAAFAEIILLQQPWPGLMDVIFGLVSSPELDSQTVGALMAEELASAYPDCLKNLADKLIEILTFISSKSQGTFKASVLAIMSRTYTNLAIGVSVKSQAYKRLCAMTEIYWMFVDNAIVEGDLDSSNEIIESVTLLLECRTKLCNEGLMKGFAKMAEIVTGAGIPPKLKKNAMTLFCRYANNFTRQLFYPHSSQSPKASPQRAVAAGISTNVGANYALVKGVVNVLIAWCSDIPDDEQWVSRDPEADDDETGEDEALIYKPDGTKYMYRAGQDFLDILAISLGYPILFGILKEVTPSLLISPEWRVRSTACIMYCICSEGFSKVPENLEKVKEANSVLSNADIQDICKAICALARDPHPRVRWAVVQALSQMCVDLSPKIQQLCGKMVIETIHTLMDDMHPVDTQLSIASCAYTDMAGYFKRPCLRVVAHATSALGSFYSEAKITEINSGVQNFVVQSIDESLGKISRLMSLDNTLIQKNCVTTLGSIANMSSTYFVSRCDLFLNPCLLQLENYLSGRIRERPSKRPFANQLIETISLIGHAVGPEKFKTYGITFMNMLIRYKVIGTGSEQMDPTLRSALFKAMSNVNNSMGKYLQVEHINAMMQSILETFKSDMNTVQLVDAGPADGYEDSDDDDDDVFEINGMKIKYNTGVMEEIEDASDLLELLLGDHFIETVPFYEAILSVSLEIVKEERLSLLEYALQNILCIVKAIKSLIKCIKHPEKNETGLSISISLEQIANMQNSIFTQIITKLNDFLNNYESDISISNIILDILRNFIFSAPQCMTTAGMTPEKYMEQFLVIPITHSYGCIKNYMLSLLANEEGDYDDAYIIDEKDNFAAYTETIGLAIASGFSFMRKNPGFNFVITFQYFMEIMTDFVAKPDRTEDIYVDLRSAACIVGQNITKLSPAVINANQVLKDVLSRVIICAMDLLTDSLTIKGSSAAVILPSSEYPTVQSAYYLLKCVLVSKENMSITNEIFGMVAKSSGMADSWAVIDYIINHCMQFAKLCLGADGNIDNEIQSSYDNAVSLWFTISLIAPARYGSYFGDCLFCVQKICEDPIEIADIIQNIHKMFFTPDENSSMLLSTYQAQIIKALVSIICNNVIRYALRPSIINLARAVLLRVRGTTPATNAQFDELVKSLNNPLIVADVYEFLKQ